MKPASDPSSTGRPTLSWLIASLTGGALMLSGSACAGTRDDELVGDIEVHLPTQAEADAAAGKSINEANADAEYRRLLSEMAEDD